jgi:hypothetical protein
MHVVACTMAYLRMVKMSFGSTVLEMLVCPPISLLEKRRDLTSTL